MTLNNKKSIKEHVMKVVNTICNYFKQLDQLPLKQIIIFSVAITFILEVLSSRHISEGLMSVFDNPIMFLYNALIIFLTLSISNFFKRRSFMLSFITLIWLIAGIINFAILGFRTTPFTGNDLKLLTSVITIIPIYLNVIQTILVAILSGLILIGIVYAFRKLPKTKLQMKNALVTLCYAIILLMGISTLAIRTESVKDNFTNLGQAYQDYGFAYCFTISIIDRGIDLPDTYSVEAIEKVRVEIDKNENTPINGYSDYKNQNMLIRATLKNVFNSLKIKYQNNPIWTIPVEDEVISEVPLEFSTDKTNVIFIQLESFFDVKYIKNYKFSANPTPNFDYIREHFSSGFLTVPTIGAGTANTEFEVLSGMSLKYFGAGEYPYKTILKEKPVESIAYNLGEIGYTSHAIHNNTGTFYSRNTVYPNLGFDSFSSIEYMDDVEYNSIGWAKDQVIESEVLKALNASEEQDFIFAVSVQPHGKYPSVVIDETQEITMTADIDESEIIAYEYFINQLHETDEFIGSLVNQLEQIDEPTILILYGDHLPSMDLENEDLINNNKFQTEYVMWSNFPLKKINTNLYAYQLSAYIMGRLGLDNGILTKLHQKNSTDVDYQNQLLLLQYDMLYGDNAIYSGEYPLKTKPMTMGTAEVNIESYEVKGEAIFINGNNFTMWSTVFIDDEIRDTLFIDSNTLIITNDDFEEAVKLNVTQTTPKNKILSQSNDILLNNE